LDLHIVGQFGHCDESGNSIGLRAGTTSRTIAPSQGETTSTAAAPEVGVPDR
jgi:hypothetical protein